MISGTDLVGKANYTQGMPILHEMISGTDLVAVANYTQEGRNEG